MDIDPLAISGRILFMPWVTIPHAVTHGGFRFAPITSANPEQVVGTEVARTVTEVLRLYVDRSGTPIESCTVVLRPRHKQAWNVPSELWRPAIRAAEALALACLAEQRFLMGHFSPHLNGSMFRLVGQGVSAGRGRIVITYPRRGNDLRVWDRFQNVKFQQPHQVEGTECEIIGTRLAKALTAARTTKNPVWGPISASLEFFLLGHSEMQDLSNESCIAFCNGV